MGLYPLYMLYALSQWTVDTESLSLRGKAYLVLPCCFQPTPQSLSKSKLSSQAHVSAPLTRRFGVRKEEAAEPRRRGLRVHGELSDTCA